MAWEGWVTIHGFDFTRLRSFEGDNKIPILGANHVSNLTIISEDGAIKFQSAIATREGKERGEEEGRETRVVRECQQESSSSFVLQEEMIFLARAASDIPLSSATPAAFSGDPNRVTIR